MSEQTIDRKTNVEGKNILVIIVVSPSFLKKYLLGKLRTFYTKYIIQFSKSEIFHTPKIVFGENGKIIFKRTHI